jgi:hypothetical protein
MSKPVVVEIERIHLIFEFVDGVSVRAAHFSHIHNVCDSLLHTLHEVPGMFLGPCWLQTSLLVYVCVCVCVCFAVGCNFLCVHHTHTYTHAGFSHGICLHASFLMAETSIRHMKAALAIHPLHFMHTVMLTDCQQHRENA